MGIRQPQMKWHDGGFDEETTGQKRERKEDQWIMPGCELQSNLRHIEGSCNGA
jgi:hypothetical protein